MLRGKRKGQGRRFHSYSSLCCGVILGVAIHCNLRPRIREHSELLPGFPLGGNKQTQGESNKLSYTISSFHVMMA